MEKANIATQAIPISTYTKTKFRLQAAFFVVAKTIIFEVVEHTNHPTSIC